MLTLKPRTALIREACIRVKQRARRLQNVQRIQNEMRKVLAWQRAAVGTWLFARVTRISRMPPCIFDPIRMSKRLRMMLRRCDSCVTHWRLQKSQFWVKAHFKLRYNCQITDNSFLSTLIPLPCNIFGRITLESTIFYLFPLVGVP